MAPDRTMVRFGDEHRHFSMRVGAVILHEGQVLVERGQDDEFEYWYLPGGRVEIGESSTDTLQREMREELGIEVQVERLTHVVEYFFAMDGVEYHQLALYFLANLPPCYLVESPGPFLRHDGEANLHFDWLPVAELSRRRLYPRFFENGTLADLPATPLHVVIRQGEEDW